jgi:hypothetical protein
MVDGINYRAAAIQLILKRIDDRIRALEELRPALSEADQRATDRSITDLVAKRGQLESRLMRLQNSQG